MVVPSMDNQLLQESLRQSGRIHFGDLANIQVKALIERALLSGNFPALQARPLVDGRRLLFPPIDIALISYPRGSVSGFAGNRRLHIAIDELVQKTLQYFSQKRTSADLTLWVKLQLAATTIHEISHVILRAVYLLESFN